MMPDHVSEWLDRWFAGLDWVINATGGSGRS
jgi:hypothetical protein